MPRVACAVLNHAITRFEKDLRSVVQFENYFARDNYVEVHRVRGVHTGMIAFQNVKHPRQFLLDLFDSGRGVELLEAPRRIRRYGEEAEAENNEAAAAEFRPTEVEGWNRCPRGDEIRNLETERGTRA